jgi:hypothetical protein
MYFILVIILMAVEARWLHFSKQDAIKSFRKHSGEKIESSGLLDDRFELTRLSYIEKNWDNYVRKL